MTIQDLKELGIKLTKVQEEKVQELINNCGSKVKTKVVEGKTLYHCKYFDKYFPIEEMVTSKGKSKGYSKLGNSIWTKLNRAYDTIVMMTFELDLPANAQAKLKNIAAYIKEAKNKPDIYKDDAKEALELVETIKEFKAIKDKEELIKAIDSYDI